MQYDLRDMDVVITHHGVKGQKWGIRRALTSTGHIVGSTYGKTKAAAKKGAQATGSAVSKVTRDLQNLRHMLRTKWLITYPNTQTEQEVLFRSGSRKKPWDIYLAGRRSMVKWYLKITKTMGLNLRKYSTKTFYQRCHTLERIMLNLT